MFPEDSDIESKNDNECLNSIDDALSDVADNLKDVAHIIERGFADFGNDSDKFYEKVTETLQNIKSITESIVDAVNHDSPLIESITGNDDSSLEKRLEKISDELVGLRQEQLGVLRQIEGAAIFIAIVVVLIFWKMS
ncbi:MAG TPA: hypothetical protein VG347_13080 [Verrucomicrobiae bacterium]|nr:hypothetical protein [Verrucomicrobiae bacterium]